MNPPAADDEPSQSTKPVVLDYAAPGRNLSSSRRRNLGIVLAVLWYFAFGIASVGSDFVRISIPKKIALTVSTVTLQPIIFRLVFRKTAGFGIIAAIYIVFISSEMVTLWFWN